MSERKTTSTNLLNEAFLENRCVLNKVLKIASQRWTAEILLLAESEPVRYSHLKSQLEGVSDMALSRGLNELMAVGLLQKAVFPEVPVRVEYGLTEAGLTFVALLHDLCKWGKRHVETTPS
jgi:DNA-binding HxlR family transcriptional regulator